MSPIPWFWIIGGPNGAGKTTLAMTFLPELAGTPHFLNADLIAKGISPLAPDAAPIESGKILIRLVKEKIARHESFAVETTLSSGFHRKIGLRLKKRGWKIGLIFICVDTVEIALRRVLERVRKGGHNIPESVIRRRYVRGAGSFEPYAKLADHWVVFDHSGTKARLVAERAGNADVQIHDPERWARFRAK